MVAGRVGAPVVAITPLAIIAAGAGIVEVEPAWLAPLLEVAITPVALVVTLAFSTAVLVVNRTEPISETWSNEQIKHLMGLYLTVGVISLGAILLYLAVVDAWWANRDRLGAAGVWWAEGDLQSIMGVIAIGAAVLTLAFAGRLSLIITGLADASDQHEQPERNAPLRWGTRFLVAMFICVPMAAAFREKPFLAVILLVLAVLANLTGLVLSAIGAWKAWRAGTHKLESAVALIWGLAPLVVAVFYFG